MTPEVRIDAANSLKAAESKSFLGWLGLTSIWSMPTSVIASSAPGADDSSAPSPRPSPRLFMFEHLSREVQIGHGTAGPQIMQHHRLAVARRLAEPDVAWNDRLEDFPGEIAMDLIADLERQTRAAIKHREHDALDR